MSYPLLIFRIFSITAVDGNLNKNFCEIRVIIDLFYDPRSRVSDAGTDDRGRERKEEKDVSAWTG